MGGHIYEAMVDRVLASVRATKIHLSYVGVGCGEGDF